MNFSDTDQTFVNMLTRNELPDEMVEYRELNHEVQDEILRRWRDKKLGVIWIGAGVFTLEHPLLKHRKDEDWHIWTDANPKVVGSAQAAFDAMRQRNESVNLSYNMMLPQDISVLNRAIKLMAPSVEHLVIQGYGVTYALTAEENRAWLSQLSRPDGLDLSFVFDAPAANIPLLPGVMAAFHQQRMVGYDREHIEALFQLTIPGSHIIWEKPRTATRNQMWSTWLIYAPAAA